MNGGGSNLDLCRASCCFVGQENLLHIVSPHPGISIRLWVKLSNALGNGPEPHPVEEGVVILLQRWTKVDTSSD